MERFEPVDIDFLINSGQVKQDADAVKKSLMQIGYTAEEAQAKVDKRVKSLLTNDALKQLPNDIRAAGHAAAQTRPQWNGLSNSINQITREGAAFAVSAQTGFLAISNNIPILADEISRLKAKNAELTASGKKGIPIWRQLVKGLFSWQTALSLGVTLLTVYGSEFISYISQLLQGKKGIDEVKASQEALNKAFTSGSYKKVIKDVVELKAAFNLAKRGVIDKDNALKLYNKTLGDVTGKTEDFDTASNALENNTSAYVKAMLFRAAATVALSEAADQLVKDQKKINELEERQARHEANIETAKGRARAAAKLGAERAVKDIEEETKASEARAASLQKIVEGFEEKANKIANEAGINIFGKKDSNTENKKVVSEYQKLLDKLTALDKEYSRKSFTKDAEELQALRDKFSTIRTLVKRFNADPKNKAQIIDLSNLDQLQVRAEASLTYRQTTEKLKTELGEQQKLFKEFEEFKTQHGITAAQKEYEGKLAHADSYYEHIKQLQKENQEAYQAVENGTATGAQVERVNFLNAEAKKAAAEERKLFNEQLASLQGYYLKRKILIENYEAQRKKLEAAGKTDAVKELDRQHKEELDAIDDANVKKLQSYKALFNGIVGLTRKEAKVVLQQARELLKIQKISGELKASILKKIAEIERLLEVDNLDNIYQLAGAIGELGQSLDDLGVATGSGALQGIGGFLSGLSRGVNDLLTVFDSEASQTDKITAGISGAINLIGMFTRAAEERKAAEEAYYLSVIGFQNDYNLALQEQIRLNSILKENVFIKDYEGRVKDALESIHVANNEYQKAIDKLIESGQVKIGQRNTVDFGNVGTGLSSGAAVGAVIGSVVPVIGNVVGAVVGGLIGAIGGLFGGKKKKDRFGAILNEYPELIEQTENGLLRVNKALAESLIANELVKGETKAILENILEWEQALEDARAQIREVITELTGSLGTDVRNLLVETFEAGENAAIRMGDTVEKVLENILTNLVFNSVFGGVFEDLENEMAKSFDIGGDGSWVDDFGRFFIQANELTEDFNQAMRDAQAEAANFGFDVFNQDIAEPKPRLSWLNT